MKKSLSNLFVKTSILLMLFGFNSQDASATVWPIPNTKADTLLQFVLNTSAWSAGDTIMLTDASLYRINASLDIYQDVTIMGSPDLPEKPTLKFNDNGFKGKSKDISITLISLKLDGHQEDGDRSNFMMRFDDPDINTAKSLVLEDVEVWGFTGGFQLYKYGGGIYDEVIINNSLFYDISGQYVIDPRISAIKTLEVTNSTFYDISHGFLKNPYFLKLDDGRTELIEQDFLIDHCTFYNVSGEGTNSFIQVNDPNDASVTLVFSNNVVQGIWNGTDGRPFRINVDAGDFLFTNSLFFDFTSTRDDGIHNLDYVATNQNNVNIFDILDFDPGLADLGSYDFSLPDSSSLIGFGTDGTSIGDPRWAPEEPTWIPGPNVHQIPNSSPDTIENFISLHTDLWEAGDTILLSSAETYLVNNTIHILEDLTLMGDPRLSGVPEIKFTENGLNGAAQDINLTITGLVLNGLHDDNSRADYLFSCDDASVDTFKTIRIENCEIKGFSGMIKLYDNAGLYDALIIENCMVHDINGGYVIDASRSAVTQLHVLSSTFYDIPHGLLSRLYYQDAGNGRPELIPQEILIQNNTIFNMAGALNGSLILASEVNDASLSLDFSNNILCGLHQDSEESAAPFNLNADAGTLNFSNSLLYSYSNGYMGGVYNLDYLADNQANVTTQSMFDYYPGFADSLNRDFTLPDSSSLLAAGINGEVIGDPRWYPDAGVSIEALNRVVNEGNIIQLSAIVKLSEGADLSLNWSVINDINGSGGEASIEASTGLFEAVTSGTVLVKVSSNYNPALSDELEIFIDNQVPVTSITLSATTSLGFPTTEIPNKGGFVTIAAVIEPGNATDQSLSWSLSGDAQASIVEVTPKTIQLIAIQCGTATVTATANDGSETYGGIDIEISGQTPVEAITVTAEGGTAAISENDGSLQMLAEIFPDTACIQDVFWYVDNTSIATISEAGLLQALSNGTVSVTARATDGTYKTGNLDVVITGQDVSAESSFVNQLRIYPNPAQDILHVEYHKPVQLCVYSLLGSELINKKLELNESLDISSLKQGVYLVSIKDRDQTKVIRLVKE